jgi:hypothetical protein
MNIRILAIATAFLLNSTGVGAETVHLPQAIEHTKAAIKHGEAGDAAVLMDNAAAALAHAKASEEVEANAHTEEGIVHLKAAIDAGKLGDADGGTIHAREALKQLEMATEPKRDKSAAN